MPLCAGGDISLWRASKGGSTLEGAKGVDEEAAMEFRNLLTDLMADALCAGDDRFISLMGQEGGSGLSAKIYRCKAICAECPVSRECMSWALRVQPVAGVWSGVNWGVRTERLALQRRTTAA